MKKLLFLALIIAIVGGGHYCVAAVNFDDLATTPGGSAFVIPAGYGGFTWGVGNYGFWVTDAADLGYPNGLTNGVVSPNNVAFNYQGGPVFISSPTPFDFFGADFSAAWLDGLMIDVQGLRNGVVVYEDLLTVDTSGAQWFTANYFNINQLQFFAFGGVNHGYDGDGTVFGMDNFNVPEPATIFLWGLGVCFLCFRLRANRAFRSFF